MKRWVLIPALTAFLIACGLIALPASARADVQLTVAEWELGPGDLVQFHLQYYNDDPLEPSPLMEAEVLAQEAYGAFLPDVGSIQQFDIPPIPPESFFDVSFDVPLDQLPPSADRIRTPPSGGGGGGALPADSFQAACPPDTNWAGNVDVIWGPPGLPGVPPGGNVQVHFGTIFVCVPGGVSYIHVLVDCPNPLGATWNFTYPLGACPGWTVTLVQSDALGQPTNIPAPAVLPPGPPPWDGWICITANSTVPVGQQCYVDLNVFCAGQTNSPAKVQLCAEACEWEPVPTTPTTWGRIKAGYR